MNDIIMNDITISDFNEATFEVHKHLNKVFNRNFNHIQWFALLDIVRIVNKVPSNIILNINDNGHVVDINNNDYGLLIDYL